MQLGHERTTGANNSMEQVNLTETVTIPKALYHSLVRADCELDALRAAGVDNWSGWGEHCDYRDELISSRLGKEFIS